MYVTCGLTHIRRGTASTREEVYNTRSEVLWDFIFEWKKGRDSSRRGGISTLVLLDTLPLLTTSKLFLPALTHTKFKRSLNVQGSSVPLNLF